MNLQIKFTGKPSDVIRGSFLGLQRDLGSLRRRFPHKCFSLIYKTISADAPRNH